MIVSLFFYNIFLKLYLAAIRLSARDGNKAQKWLQGREGIFEKIKSVLKDDERRIWIHCASLGEFEQGRPVIEALKKDAPEFKIVLTFFSPSGYELKKDYEQADYVFYLPMDGKQHAERFIGLIKPELALFVKYEFWYYYLRQLYQSNIPAILMSAAFRESQPFFKWYGTLFRQMLSFYNHIFLQDETSEKLLEKIVLKEKMSIGGDTRYDRVAEIAAMAKGYPLIEAWKGTSQLWIGGSTWKDDEVYLHSALDFLPDDWKIVIAPHEIDETHLREIETLFGSQIVRYSKLSLSSDEKVLLIDNYGMLSSLYRYGAIAFIGSGFKKDGIHNILEATIYGMPVFFGPYYKKFVEASEMVACGLAFPVNDMVHFKEKAIQIMTDNAYYAQLQTEIRLFMKAHEGATKQILAYIQHLIKT